MAEEFLASGLSDGLPLLPATEDSIADMVTATGRDATEVLGSMPPGDEAATVGLVAANAVLAGCLPAYAPVVLAAVEAVLDPAFALYGIACSTKGAAPLVIVNGPIRRTVGLHSGGNVFGHGTRANATIGRALRLVIQNVGRARADELDRSTLGHPGKYSYCIAEDEEGSPWPPLHARRGRRADESAVTVVGCEAPRQVSVPNGDGAVVLLALAQALASTGFGMGLGTRNPPHVVVIATEHRDLLAAEGWSADDVAGFISEHAVVPEEVVARVPGLAPGPLRAVDDPADLLVVAAGGAAGRFSSVLPGWTWQSQPVTRPVCRS